MERLTSDGSLDTSFNSLAPGVYAATTLPSGKLIIGGAFTLIDGKQKNYVARLNSDGSLDDTFTTATPSFIVTSLLGQDDGKIIIGGPFSDVGGTARHGIARLDVQGNLDIGFNLGGRALPVGERALAILRASDGGLIVGGQAALYRLSSSGVLDSSFPKFQIGGGNFGSVAEIDGQIYVGGNLLVAGKMRPFFRLSLSGVLDAGFEPDFGVNIPFITAIAPHPSGGALIAGTFDRIDGELRFGIARFNRLASQAIPILGIRRAPVISLSGQSGISYRIEFTQNLRTDPWSALTTVTLDSNQYEFVDREDVSDRRFYRAIPLIP